MSDQTASAWSFHLYKAEHRFYVTYEGSVETPEETEGIHCFLLLGQDHFTAELKSLSRTIPEDVMAAWIIHLGAPAYGPITHSRTGEIEESIGEMILTATWRFPAEAREAVGAKIEGLLERQACAKALP